MREYIVEADQAGRRVDRWMAKQVPTLSLSMAQKYVRTKCVRRNGKHPKAEDILEAGDRIQLYLPDEILASRKIDRFLRDFRVHLNILYEDSDILIVDKRPGLAVHADEHEKVDTLLNHVRAYLYQKGEYDSMSEGAFAPALCNRIDRFTGGIVIAAKNEDALKAVDNMIRERRVEKRYLLICRGRMHPENGLLRNYLQPTGKRVKVFNAPVEGAKESLTRYRTLSVRGDLSLVECELLTGRTHQIRAQFAYAGHPLLGDTQYGASDFNQKYNRQVQALYAYSLSFRPEAGKWEYLASVSARVQRVSFADEFFPEFSVPPNLEI